MVPMLAILALLAMLAAALPVLGDSGVTRVELKQSAILERGAVHLADVATLTGPMAGKLAELTLIDDLARFTGTVDLKSVRAAIEKAEVNPALVSVGGFTRCTLTDPKAGVAAQATEKKKPSADPLANPAVIRANPMETLDVATATTVRQRIVQVVSALARDPAVANQLDFTFRTGDAAALDATIDGDRIEVVPSVNGVPGRVPVTVRRYVGDEVQTFHYTLDVARRIKAVVARRQISRGQVFTADDIELRDSSLLTPGKPIADLSAVLGQVSKTLLRAGTVVCEDSISAPLSVKKGELITVRCVAGSLVITTVARAMADGSVGQTIAARNERSRQDMAVKLTGDREAVMLLDTASAPVKPGRAATELAVGSDAVHKGVR